MMTNSKFMNWLLEDNPTPVQIKNRIIMRRWLRKWKKRLTPDDIIFPFSLVYYYRIDWLYSSPIIFRRYKLKYLIYRIYIKFKEGYILALQTKDAVFCLDKYRRLQMQGHTDIKIDIQENS